MKASIILPIVFDVIIVLLVALSIFSVTLAVGLMVGFPTATHP
jgi:hypothetical protein